MRRLIIVLMLLAACQSASVRSHLAVFYSSSSARISLEHETLRVTRLSHEYSSPVSAVPSSTHAFTSEYPVTSKDIEVLRAALQKGFFELPEACGAPAGERHYPYTIRAEMDGRRKEVVYRSNPSFGRCGEAFHRFEKALLDLAAEKSR